MEDRVAEVHAWQRAYGMEPRADSSLTRLYAQGQAGQMDAAEVARELVAVDHLYKHTLYGEVIEEFMRAVARLVREQYRLTWTATWNVVRAYAPIALKLLMVLRTGVRIPQCGPRHWEAGEQMDVDDGA